MNKKKKRNKSNKREKKKERKKEKMKKTNKAEGLQIVVEKYFRRVTNRGGKYFLFLRSWFFSFVGRSWLVVGRRRGFILIYGVTKEESGVRRILVGG